jgi:O-antigen/teichoic acid export membrane protein
MDIYGIWAIVTVIAGYFGLLDLGVGVAFIRNVSVYYAKKDFNSINRLINTGIIFYIAFTIVVGTIAYFSIGTIIDILHYPTQLRDDAFTVFFWGIVLFGLSSIGYVISSIQTGIQRMDLLNKVSIIASIPMALGTVYFLESGYGMKGLMINNYIVFGITFALNAIIAYRLFPQLKINPALFSVDMLKMVVNFGYKVQVGTIADTITLQTDKLLITYFISPAMTGFYQVGSSLAQTIRGLPILLISALLPAASEISANQDHESLRQVYARGTKYLMLVSFPMTFYTFAMAGIIMLAWMNSPDYGISAIVIQILIIGYLFNLICGVAASIGMAMDHPEYSMHSSIITIVTNLVLCVVLVYFLGVYGIALAGAISLAVSAIYFMVKFHWLISMPMIEFIKCVVTVPLIASVLPAAVLFFAFNTGIIQPGSGRIENFAILAVSGTAYMIAYLAVILWRSYIDDYDIALVKRYLGWDSIVNLVMVRDK